MSIDPPSIDNCVATFRLVAGASASINLVSVSRSLGFVEYNSHRFAAASLRLRKPKTTCLLFSSSNCVVTGASSQKSALHAAWIYVSLLRRYDPNFTIHNWRVQNLVSSGSIAGLLHLVPMHAAMSETTAYEHELFPGLVVREPDLQPVVLCFRSGKYVITGSKTIADIHEARQRLLERVQPYITSSAGEVNSAAYHHRLRSERIIMDG